MIFITYNLAYCKQSTYRYLPCKNITIVRNELKYFFLNVLLFYLFIAMKILYTFKISKNNIFGILSVVVDKLR